jgi:sec-independent protein translocase protein TatA
MGLPNIGPLELIIILAIALLVVGPGRLPEMGNAIGRTIREFRKASSDMADIVEPDKPAPKPAPSSEPTALPPNTLSSEAIPNTTAVAPEPEPATSSDPRSDGDEA